jgi:hypothetical protein
LKELRKEKTIKQDLTRKIENKEIKDKALKARLDVFAGLFCFVVFGSLEQVLNCFLSILL